MRKLLLTSLTVLATVFTAGNALAAESIGKVVVLTGVVNAQSPNGSSSLLKAGDVIYENQTIITGAQGKAQIIFNDKSIITVGKNAEMLLDEYVYDPQSGDGKSIIEMSRGIFKFVTGKIAKNDPEKVKMNTPFATIGVRGSGGIVEVASTGLTTLSMTDCCINITPRGASSASAVELTTVNTFSRVAASGAAPTAPQPMPLNDMTRLQSEMSMKGIPSSKDEVSKGVKAGGKKEASRSRAIQGGEKPLTLASLLERRRAQAQQPTSTPVVDNVRDIDFATLTDKVLTEGADINHASRGVKKYTSTGAPGEAVTLEQLRVLEVDGVQNVAYLLSNGEKNVVPVPLPGSDTTITVDGTEFRTLKSDGGALIVIVENNGDPTVGNTVLVVGDETSGVDRLGSFDSTLYNVYNAVVKNPKDGGNGESAIRLFVDAIGVANTPRALAGEVKFGGDAGSVLNMFSARIKALGPEALEGDGYSFKTKSGNTTAGTKSLRDSTLYGTPIGNEGIETTVGNTDIVFIRDGSAAGDAATAKIASNNLFGGRFNADKLYATGFKIDEGGNVERVASKNGDLKIEDSGIFSDSVNARFELKAVDAQNTDTANPDITLVKFNDNATVVSKQVYGSELGYSSSNGTAVDGSGALLSSEFVDTTGITTDCKNCQHITWGVWAAELNNASSQDILQLVPYLAGENVTNIDTVSLPGGVTHATYNGVLAGSISDGSTVTNHLGNFSTDVDFGTRKIGNFVGELAGHDLVHNAVDTSITAGGFSFDLDSNATIESGSVSGALFGADAEEIGGQFLFDTKTAEEGAGIFAGER